MRRQGPVGTVLAVVLIAGCGASHTARDEPSTATPDDRWTQVLSRLDRVRADALATDDPARLRKVYVRGAEMLRLDLEMLAGYRHRGLRLGGATLRLHDVQLVRRDGPRVTLRVVDQLGSTRVREPGGAWRDLPTDAPTARSVELVRTTDGWRIRSARRLAG